MCNFLDLLHREKGELLSYINHPSMSLRNISFYFRRSFITKAFRPKNVVLNNIFAKAESIKKFLLLPVHLGQHYHLGRF